MHKIYFLNLYRIILSSTAQISNSIVYMHVTDAPRLRKTGSKEKHGLEKRLDRGHERLGEYHPLTDGTSGSGVAAGMEQLQHQICCAAVRNLCS